MRRINDRERVRFRRRIVADCNLGLLTAIEMDRLLGLCERPYGMPFLWDQRRRIVGPRRRELFIKYAIALGLVGLLMFLPQLLRLMK